VIYENLEDPTTASAELSKIATVLEGKAGMNIIGSETFECVYNETLKYAGPTTNSERDGPKKSEYIFTLAQITTLYNTLVSVHDKYNTLADKTAEASLLVEALSKYISEVGVIKAEMEADPPEVIQHAPSYHEDLKDWFNSIGRGDRYSRPKVEPLQLIWQKMRHFYQ